MFPVKSKCFVFLGSWLVLPVAIAASTLQTNSVPATRASASTPSVDTQPQMCLADVFFGPLPGKADYCLGMRDWNKGHYSSGLEFLELAAGWGNKSAQYTLGLIHYSGHHVAADPVLGMAWLKLADERDNDADISRARKSAFKWATPAQREQADTLFTQMQGKYGDKVAAVRAWQHLQHWQRSHDASNAGCVRLSGAEAAAAKRMGLAGVPPSTLSSMVDIRPGGDTSADRKHKAPARAGVCVTLQMRQHVTQRLADHYFRGFIGTVTVEPLEVVPAPAESSGH